MLWWRTLSMFVEAVCSTLEATQTAIEITLATNLVDGISGLTRPHCGSDMSRCVPELQKTPTAATHIIFQFWYPIA